MQLGEDSFGRCCCKCMDSQAPQQAPKHVSSMGIWCCSPVRCTNSTASGAPACKTGCGAGSCTSGYWLLSASSLQLCGVADDEAFQGQLLCAIHGATGPCLEAWARASTSSYQFTCGTEAGGKNMMKTSNGSCWFPTVFQRLFCVGPDKKLESRMILAWEACPRHPFAFFLSQAASWLSLPQFFQDDGACSFPLEDSQPPVSPELPELLQPVVPETTDKNEVNVCMMTSMSSVPWHCWRFFKETGPSPVIERFLGSRQFYDASDQPSVVFRAQNFTTDARRQSHHQKTRANIGSTPGAP